MRYSTPVLLAMGALMVLIAWLVGLELWMVAAAAAIALIGFLLERRGD